MNWILVHKFGLLQAYHYLDDYIFIEPSYQEALYALNTFKAVCARLGVPLSEEKTVGPSQNLQFLGIHLDTVNLIASIPQEKIDKYHDLLVLIVEVRSATQGEIKSLIGCLNWCTSIILAGRSFLRRLYEIVLGPHCPEKTICISDEAVKDLKVWEVFLNHFNGRGFIEFAEPEPSSELNFYTDASYEGAGGTFKSNWFQIRYPPHWREKHITYLELYPVVVAAHLFAEQISGRHVVFHTDNTGVMHMLNKCSSTNEKFMPLLEPWHFWDYVTILRSLRSTLLGKPM